MSEWLRAGKPGLLYASPEKPGKSLSAPPVLSSRHADPVTKTRSSSTNAPVCSGSGSPPGSASCKFPITESRCRGFGLPRLSYASRRPKPFRQAECPLLRKDEGKLPFPAIMFIKPTDPESVAQLNHHGRPPLTKSADGSSQSGSSKKRSNRCHSTASRAPKSQKLLTSFESDALQSCQSTLLG